MRYIDLKEKARAEGIEITIKEYTFAYVTMLGEPRDEAYNMAVSKHNDPERPPAKRGRPSKTKTPSYDQVDGSKYYYRPTVQWIMKELAILFPKKIDQYMKKNLLAAKIIEKEQSQAKKGKVSDHKLSVDEIESFLTDTIRAALSSDEGDAIPLKERMGVVNFIKLYLDKLRPVDTTSEDIDRVLVECIEPANVICPYCRREYYLDITNDKIKDTFKKKLCGDCQGSKVEKANIPF